MGRLYCFGRMVRQPGGGGGLKSMDTGLGIMMNRILLVCVVAKF